MRGEPTKGATLFAGTSIAKFVPKNFSQSA